MTPPRIRSRQHVCWPVLALAMAMVFATACASPRPVSNSDGTFGHRVSGSGSDGRTTIAISAPDENVEYRFSEASYDQVTIRPEPTTQNNADSGVRVEVLIKGSFPDSCTELHDVVQQRAGNLVLVTLTMRRPQGAVCASVLRPYRFYLGLDGLYQAGPYSMKLNDVSHAFVIRNPQGS